jgi:hypothetical protein
MRSSVIVWHSMRKKRRECWRLLIIGPGVSNFVNRALPILLMLMALWTQALPGIRCLHTGNVLPITALLTSATHCCCCDGEGEASHPGSSHSIKGKSCYESAPADTSFSRTKLKISSVQALVAFVRFSLSERSARALRPVVIAESRAPPWSARISQLTYLSHRSLLI